MCRLDRPVPAIEGEQPLRGCGLPVQAGDPVGRLDAPLAGLDLDGFAAHGEDLADAGEVQVAVEFAGGPDGTPLVAAVFRLCGLDREVRCALGDDLVEQKPDVVEQGRLVALDGEHIVGAPGEEILGEGALGEQRIGGDGQAGDIGQRLEQGNDGADLVGTFLPVAGVRPQADFFCA